MDCFKYGQKEIEYLKRKDKKLAAAIDRIGIIEREITPDPLIALVSSIISQQVSKKAAETVWNRFCELVGEVKPENIMKADPEAIQQ
jgi:DNA-3-methyladenine glycosylase II